MSGRAGAGAVTGRRDGATGRPWPAPPGDAGTGPASLIQGGLLTAGGEQRSHDHERARPEALRLGFPGVSRNGMRGGFGPGPLPPGRLSPPLVTVGAFAADPGQDQRDVVLAI